MSDAREHLDVLMAEDREDPRLYEMLAQCQMARALAGLPGRGQIAQDGDKIRDATALNNYGRLAGDPPDRLAGAEEADALMG